MKDTGKTHQWMVMRTFCGLAYTEEEWAGNDSPFWRCYAGKVWRANRCFVGYTRDQVVLEIQEL